MAGSGKEERVARIFDVNAGNKKRIGTAVAGQIVLLAGLKHATTGDTLCRVEHEVLLERIESRDPVLGLAIEPERSQDEEKLLEVIAKVCEEDPTLKFVEDEETGQFILSGMGELHLMIVFERISREFGVNVRAGKPRVVSRETIRFDADMLLIAPSASAPTTPRSSRSACRDPEPLERGTTVMVTTENHTILPEGSALSSSSSSSRARGRRWCQRRPDRGRGTPGCGGEHRGDRALR